MTKTVRDVTFELLRELEITTVFGNPGSTEETFLQDFPEDFQYIQTLHESSAVGMADGYAQAQRKVALVNVHTSAGLSNAMSNILSASMNKTPLIITAGNQTREMLLMEPWLTNVEPEVLPKPWVKWSYQPVRAEDVPAAFMRAYAIATQPPAGPVFLSIPLDDWNQPFTQVKPVVRTVASRIAADPERLNEFAQAFNSAKNPVLILGSSIARGEGWQDAIHLAEKLNVPVWAAPASERPPFPETHPLYAGNLPFAIQPLAEKLQGHDVALIIGAPVFRYYPYVAGEYLPQGLKLLHITDDPNESGRAPVGDSLLADAVLALQALYPLLNEREQHQQTGIIDGQSNLSKQTTLSESNQQNSNGSEAQDNSPLSALSVFQTLREIAPANTVLVEESPSNLADLHRAWPIDQPDSFYTFASGSLGWNLPASVGIALAEQKSKRDRLVLTVIGDGSLQYSIQALWNAAQLNLPMIFVVLRNYQYGILKSFAVLEETPNVPGLDLPGLDIVSLAKGYGCQGIYAQTLDEIKQAFQQAIKSKQPTVIEIPICDNIPPLI